MFKFNFLIYSGQVVPNLTSPDDSEFVLFTHALLFIWIIIVFFLYCQLVHQDKWTKNQLVRKQNLLVSHRHIFPIHSFASLHYILPSINVLCPFPSVFLSLRFDYNETEVKQYHVRHWQSGGEPKSDSDKKKRNPNRTSKEYRNVRIPSGSRRIYLAGITTSGLNSRTWRKKSRKNFTLMKTNYIFARGVYLILDVDFNIIFNNGSKVASDW